MNEVPSGYLPGRRLVQVPGPTNVPGRVLQALARPTIDHRGPQFAELTKGLLPDLRRVFKTAGTVAMFAGSGTGAWEAALANTMSPGDKVLCYEIGHFASLWAKMAAQFGLDVEGVDTDWHAGVDVAALEQRLRQDRDHAVKALLVTHNETSTGAMTDVAAVRRALDAAGHPALLLVDAVSSLASIDYRHDEWGVDVTVAGSQKGLMLPPGLCFNAIGERALLASKSARLPRAYWEWAPVLEQNEQGMFPYTPPTNLLFGLREALDMLFEEGLEPIFARHRRHGAATRAAVGAWGLERQCTDPASFSPTVTAVVMPEGHREEAFRRTVLDGWGMSLGGGLGRLAGRVFRIGHLGDFDDLMLLGTLGGVELGLARAGVPHRSGGVAAAMEILAAGEA